MSARVERVDPIVQKQYLLDYIGKISSVSGSTLPSLEMICGK